MTKNKKLKQPELPCKPMAEAELPGMPKVPAKTEIPEIDCAELAKVLDEILNTEYQEYEDKVKNRHESNRYQIMKCMWLTIRKGFLSTEQIHEVFGAPGAWGYGTPIGDALLRIYQGKSQEK